MKQKIYISLFAILYLIVAFSSFWHAVSFFGLANNYWMSIILAFAFEVGQAAVLFSLLTSAKDRSRIMPWVLMTMFTLVQVIGNVFSSYKYLKLNSVNDLVYFKEPIFIWTSLPDDQATVIVTYIVGAILPVCALLLTSMITNYLSDQEEINNDKTEEKNIVKTVDDVQKENKENSSKDIQKDNDDVNFSEEKILVDEPKKVLEEEIETEPDKALEEEIETEPDKELEEEIETEPEKTLEEEIEAEPEKALEEEIEAEPEKALEEEIEAEPEKQHKESHFINLN